jgi:hypothetical protein
MLNRSKIVIDVEPFIFLFSYSVAMQQCRMPYGRPQLNGRVNYLQPPSGHAPRRTAAFPNGDVRDALTLRGIESTRRTQKRRLTCIDGEREGAAQESVCAMIPRVIQPLRTRSGPVTGVAWVAVGGFQFWGLGHH